MLILLILFLIFFLNKYFKYLFRISDEQLIEKSKKIESSKSWKTVVDMCDFGHKNTGTGHFKDTSRLRSILIQLKNSTNAA